MSEAVLDALVDQHRELDALLAPLDEDGWARPSACEGWAVADVVVHLAQTNELAVASAQGRFDDGLQTLAGGFGPVASVDEGAAQLVASARTRSADEVLRWWRNSASALVDALRAGDPHARVTWVAGELSLTTLASTRLAESWIHTGDVAYAFGVPPSATDRLWHIARLAWRTVPYAFARAGKSLSGPVAFELRGPSGEEWRFSADDEPSTLVRGSALELCLVAGQRRDAASTGLVATGPDGDAVLELVRTFA